jgi:hypothetical protein
MLLQFLLVLEFFHIFKECYICLYFESVLNCGDHARMYKFLFLLQVMVFWVMILCATSLHRVITRKTMTRIFTVVKISSLAFILFLRSLLEQQPYWILLMCVLFMAIVTFPNDTDYSKAMIKSNGDKALPCFTQSYIGNMSYMFTYTNFTRDFIQPRFN